MKVYALVGKSGTGKSYQAVNLCKEYNIESIIDDGLFIFENDIIAGESAKRQATKVGAVKTALFSKDEHRDEVVRCIKGHNPEKVLVIGTSDEMVRRIASRLDLPPIGETIYIDDITTEGERAIANKQRHDLGKHVIPVPTFQLKRQFSGYFVDPLRIFRSWGAAKGGFSEKSVVRPTYSYLGDYKLSDKVFDDIITYIADEIDGVEDVLRVITVKAMDGLDMTVLVNMKSGYNLIDQGRRLQLKAIEKIEKMTAFNINKLDIEVRGLK